MKIKSGKAKGRMGAQQARKMMLEAFPTLGERDILVTPGGVPGPDLYMSQTLQDAFRFDIECKNSETLNIFKALEQSEKRCENGLSPLVIFKRNRTKMYCALEFQKFLEMIK